MLKKIKSIWRHTFHYKVMFVTTKGTYTVEHRIGRRPVMSIQGNLQKMRGASYKSIIFDEYVNDPLQEKAELEEREYRNKS